MASLARDDKGRNVFHAAALSGSLKTTQRLLSGSSKKTIQTALAMRDGAGRTPAHEAAHAGNIRVLRVLLEALPDSASLRDGEGYSVYDILRHREPQAFDSRRSRVVTWGDNSQHSLGRSNDFSAKISPGLIDSPFRYTSATAFDDVFRPQDLRSIAIGPSHSILITDELAQDTSRVFVAGIGGKSASTLGLSGSASADRFTQLSLPSDDDSEDPTDHLHPVMAAVSKNHSMVISQTTCWTWGSNAMGQLGIEDGKKYVATPQRLEEFIEYKFMSKMNSFTALQSSNTDRIPSEVLKGCATSDYHCVAYTRSHVWAWGTNNGQMMGKTDRGIVETPTLILKSKSKLGASTDQVDCCDNATIVLLNGGNVVILSEDSYKKLEIGAKVVEIRACGRYFAALTESGRLLRFELSPSGSLTSPKGIKVWSPRRDHADKITSFDVSAKGNVVLTTIASAFTWEAGDYKEIAWLDGMNLKTVRCSPSFGSFMAVQEYFLNTKVQVEESTLVEDILSATVFAKARASLDATAARDIRSAVALHSEAETADYTPGPAEIIEVGAATVETSAHGEPEQSAPEAQLEEPAENWAFFENKKLPQSAPIGFDWLNPPVPTRYVTSDAIMQVRHRKIHVHSAVLFGRSSQLASLLGNRESVITRGGIKIEMTAGPVFRVTGAEQDSVYAFVHYLYTGMPVDSPSSAKGKEFRDLITLVDTLVEQGFLRMLEFSQDTTVALEDGQAKAHSFVLASRSSYFRARLSERWLCIASDSPDQDVVDLKSMNVATFERVLRFMYSDLPRAALEGISGDEFEAVDQLVQLWYAANELMLPQLQSAIDAALIEMVTLENALAVLSDAPEGSAVASRSLNLVCSFLDYFVHDLANLSSQTMEKIERAVTSSGHVERPQEDMLALIEELGKLSVLKSSAPASASASQQSSKVNSPRLKPVSQTSVPPDLKMSGGTTASVMNAATATPTSARSPRLGPSGPGSAGSAGSAGVGPGGPAGSWNTVRYASRVPSPNFGDSANRQMSASPTPIQGSGYAWGPRVARTSFSFDNTPDPSTTSSSLPLPSLGDRGMGPSPGSPSLDRDRRKSFNTPKTKLSQRERKKLHQEEQQRARGDSAGSPGPSSSGTPPAAPVWGQPVRSSNAPSLLEQIRNDSGRSTPRRSVNSPAWT